MSYLTERQLEDRMDLPVALPLTEIQPGDSLVLAVFQLSSPLQKLTHRVMQIQVLSRDPLTPAQPVRVLDNKGYVYVELSEEIAGIVANSRTDVNLTPQPLVIPVGASRAIVLEVTGPASGVAVYTMRLYNNCQGVVLRVTATGQLRVDLSTS